MKHKISEAFKAIVASIRAIAEQSQTVDEFQSKVAEKHGKYEPVQDEEDDTPEITEDMIDGAKFPQMPFNDALKVVSRAGSPKSEE